LYIDPLLASTYLGGGGFDVITALAIDTSGNIYVAGVTASTNFPTTSGSYNKSFNGGVFDVFISKLDSNLSKLLASTYLGGSLNEETYALAIDSSGNVYVTGYTNSSTDFPTTEEAYKQNYNGGVSDVFISKLNSNLTKLLASTYLGGNDEDKATSLIIDISGNIYIAGYTKSKSFPITSGAFQANNKGYSDIFVSKLNSKLTTLVASTYLGGSKNDEASALAIDNSGNVYVAGMTFSENFPITPGAFQTNNKGYSDIFVSKLDSKLTTLVASTYLGGSENDEASALAVDNSGNVYVTGKTFSENFPITPGAFQTSYKGKSDGFVSKLNSNLTTLLASTYIGGKSDDGAFAIVLDNSGNIYVLGITLSKDFPITSGAFQTSFNVVDIVPDIFISRLDSNLTKLLASTYFGGNGNDLARAIAIDSSGNIYVAGATSSKDLPTTSGAYQTIYKSSFILSNGFISKFDANLSVGKSDRGRKK
jgi:hypothetical protein